MTGWQGTIFAAALLFAAVSFVKSRGRIKPKPLMTANEIEFFHRLQRAVPACHVFPQVSFAAILTDDRSLTGKARWNIRAGFDRKIADFLICERGTLKVLAIVELDDRTHSRRADRRRDRITQAAGYRTIRFPSTPRPTVAQIANRIAAVR